MEERDMRRTGEHALDRERDPRAHYGGPAVLSLACSTPSEVGEDALKRMSIYSMYTVRISYRRMFFRKKN